MSRKFAAILSTIFCLLLAIPAAADNAFQPLLTSDGMFSEGELATLQRDADLAQRSGVPIMFAIVPADGTSVGSAQAIADDFREEHAVETASGADDGIVFVVLWIADSPQDSTVVYSAGDHAYDTTGLSDTTISTYIDETVMPILHDGSLFEAGAYLMRFTRYTSLYVPPPVREITGVANVVQNILMVAAPLAVIGLGIGLARERTADDRRRWLLIGLTLAGSLAMAALSVWTHSRIGIGSVALALVVLAIWCWRVTRDDTRESIDLRTLLPDALITIALITISLVINIQHVDSTPTDRDETRWINRAYYAVDLKDPFGPTWQDYTITVGQPPLGSIAIGTGLALQGEDVRATAVWDYQYDKNWYQATGGFPTEEARTAGRNTNAVIGALATGAAYVLGRLLSNRAGGIAAGIYLAWHPLHIVLSSQALSDETFALLLLLALIAAWQFATKPTWTRAIALGILLGLGGATKLTPLLLAPPLAVFGSLRLLADRTPTGKRAGWMLIAQPFIAFAAFVAIYPWLWENPIGRAWRLFAFRAGEMDAQTSAWPQSETGGPFEALARFGQKLTYTHSTSQSAMQYLYDWIGIQRTAVGIDLVLAAAGAVILLWSIARTGLWTPRALVALLLFGEIAILAIGMNADFYRYHLPVVMIVSACIATTIGAAWNLAMEQLQGRNATRSTELSPEVAI